MLLGRASPEPPDLASCQGTLGSAHGWTRDLFHGHGHAASLGEAGAAGRACPPPPIPSKKHPTLTLSLPATSAAYLTVPQGALGRTPDPAPTQLMRRQRARSRPHRPLPSPGASVTNPAVAISPTRRTGSTINIASLRSATLSLPVTPRRRENLRRVARRRRLSLGLGVRGSAWRRGPTLQGHALLLRARRSDFRIPDRGPRAARRLMGTGLEGDVGMW